MGPIAGNPTIIGDHRLSTFAHPGPASYVEMTAAPVAGGDTVTAREAGLHNIEAVWPVAGLSDSGTYRVEGVAPAGNPSDDRNAAATGTSWVLRWVVVATGAQVAAEVDLSEEVVRLTAIGRY